MQQSLCGLGAFWKRLSAKFNHYVSTRTSYGYTMGLTCMMDSNIRQNVITTIYKAESSSTCSGSSRKKRATSTTGICVTFASIIRYLVLYTCYGWQILFDILCLTYVAWNISVWQMLFGVQHLTHVVEHILRDIYLTYSHW